MTGAEADAARPAVDALAACERPVLVGVRHHSPALAASMGALLDALAPDRLLVELPGDLEPWLDWLAHPQAEAPLALAAARADGRGLAFYPFADFSPELAALRWARARGVPMTAIDLPVGARRDPGDHGAGDVDPGDRTRLHPAAGPSTGLTDVLLRATGSAGVDDLWDRLVEAHAPASAPEAIRRAGLLVGWLLRRDADGNGTVPPHDLQREAWMADQVAESLAAGERPVAVIGAFHAPAVAAVRTRRTLPAGAPFSDTTTSLIPYDFELLDSRSGYPAGIRDPTWQQLVHGAAGDPAALASAAVATITAVTRELRRLGASAGVPDSREALRVAEDLARLRDLPAPGRRELVEALAATLVQGEPLGRGRLVARAMDHVLVGRRRGRLAPGTPRSGLAVHVEALLADLDLPGPQDATDAVDIRLDPFRSPLDARRHLTLRRLEACAVPYGRLISGAGAAPEALTFRWSLQWHPATAALLESAGTRGVTLPQAADGALRARHREAQDSGNEVLAALVLLEGATECGLEAAVDDALVRLAEHGPVQGTLVQHVAGADILERIAGGLIPGHRSPPAQIDRCVALVGELLEAALRAVDGMAGSDLIDDARAVAALVARFVAAGDGDERVRLGWSLTAIAQDGSPLMQGVAAIALVLLGRAELAPTGTRVGSWIDTATTAEARGRLTARLRGLLATAASMLEASPDLLAGLLERVEGIDDDAFLARLPALRGGFDVLSPAARARFFAAVCERLGLDPRGLATLDHDPLQLGRWAAADAAGRAEVEAFDPAALGAEPDEPGDAGLAPVRPDTAAGDCLLAPIDRWRLVLGHEREQTAPLARRAGTALDELYGRGRGEGSRTGLGGGRSHDPSFPSVREWAEELDDLFGTAVREEVLGVAAGSGRADAALALDPELVQPSVELLQSVLSLRGGLNEANLVRLRRLVATVVDTLVRQLATRTRPALTGTVSNRPTRRRGGPLDLRRTVAANLHTARRPAPGHPVELVPDHLVFSTRSRRSLDWSVVLVVDVSGSMEASVVHAALMAAIIGGLPAVTANFVAFSTEVVDLSDRVDDPLGLLLEISVGGGTNIAKGLHYAHTLVTVPVRTMVVLISDFDEGGAVGDLVAEVRQLAEAGAHLLGLAALDDTGAPRYSVGVAEQVVGAGMPVAALTPLELARWVGEQIR